MTNNNELWSRTDELQFQVRELRKEVEALKASAQKKPNLLTRTSQWINSSHTPARRQAPSHSPAVERLVVDGDVVAVDRNGDVVEAKREFPLGNPYAEGVS